MILFLWVLTATMALALVCGRTIDAAALRRGGRLVHAAAAAAVALACCPLLCRRRPPPRTTVAWADVAERLGMDPAASDVSIVLSRTAMGTRVQVRGGGLREARTPRGVRDARVVLPDGSREPVAGFGDLVTAPPLPPAPGPNRRGGHADAAWLLLLHARAREALDDALHRRQNEAAGDDASPVVTLDMGNGSVAAILPPAADEPHEPAVAR